MHALNLIPHLGELSEEEADEWIRSALSAFKALRRHDGHLYPLTSDPVAMQTAKGLRLAWQGWLDDAQSLTRCLPPSKELGVHPERDELRIGIGFARAILAMTPEEILRRAQAIESGEARLISVEEARRELGLAPRR
jgi:hypothetical protein